MRYSPRQSALWLVLWAVLIGSTSSATTIYVNNTAGSDTNSGTLAENQGGDAGPLRTIREALRRVSRGDTISLANTPHAYNECISLQGARHSGMSFAPFVLDGNGATLDGSASIPASGWKFVRGDVFRFSPDRKGHQLLLMDGEPAEELPRFNAADASQFLEPKQWCNVHGDIYFRVEKGKSPSDYPLRYAQHPVGITLYNVENVVLNNLVVRGYKLDGINAHDNAMDCILSGVTAAANGRSGISVNGASRVKIVESRLTGNSVVQLRCDHWSTTQLIQSDLNAKVKPIWTRHVNQRGQGARLYVNGERQTQLQGWKIPEPSEPPKEPGTTAVPEPEEPSTVTPNAPLEIPADASDSPAGSNEEADEEGSLLEDTAPEEATAPTENDDLFDDSDPFGDSTEAVDTDDLDMEEDDPFGDF